MKKTLVILGLVIIQTSCILDSSTKNNNSDLPSETKKISKIDGINFPKLAEQLLSSGIEEARITLKENNFNVAKATKESRITGRKNEVYVSFPAMFFNDNGIQSSVAFSFSEQYWNEHQDKLVQQFEDYNYTIEEDSYQTFFGLGREIKLRKNDYSVEMGIDIFNSTLAKTYSITIIR